MSTVASTISYPNTVPGAPEGVVFYCDACRGTGRGPVCPGCGGAAVPASRAKPSPPPTSEPSTYVAEPLLDERIAKLLDALRANPQTIRDLDRRVSDLSAKLDALQTTLAETKIKISIGAAKEKSLNPIYDQIADVESELSFAASELKAAVKAGHFITSQIDTRVAERRAEIAKDAVTAARRFAGEITSHLDAIEKLVAEAEELGAKLDLALGETTVSGHRFFANEDGGVAVGVLRFFGRSGRRSPLAFVDRFRNLVSRLG